MQSGGRGAFFPLSAVLQVRSHGQDRKAVIELQSAIVAPTESHLTARDGAQGAAKLQRLREVGGWEGGCGARAHNKMRGGMGRVWLVNSRTQNRLKSGSFLGGFFGDERTPTHSKTAT